MKRLMLFFALSSAIQLFGQTGNSGDPYTSLGQAWFVPSSGIYHFNIGGTTFSSYVEFGNGWILIASGNSSTSESSYTSTSALTLQSDAILPSSIYTSTLVTDVRMNATSGPGIPFDVQSSNATVLGNLQNDRTLSVGTNDTNWTGTGTASLVRICSGNSASLSTNIYHACGNPGNLHWQVGQNSGHEKVIFSNASKNNLNLWIRAASVALPIELLNFDIELIGYNDVRLKWQTASEINNHSFTIERSRNTIDWEIVETIAGAGNASSTLSYSTIDIQPFNGISYYRLKQTDFDGNYKYSENRVIKIEKESLASVLIYPNPTYNEINIEAEVDELEQIKVFNVLGQNVGHLISIQVANEKNVIINFSELTAGIYYIQTRTKINKVYKE